MCYRIDAEFVLANYFQHSTAPLTFGKLRDIRNAIQKEVEDCIYIDVSAPSLASAVELYPRMFQWVGDTIGRVENTDTFFESQYLAENFNEEVSEKIRSKALQAIESQVQVA